MKKGFTLIESLVYLALFGLIFASIIQFVLFITEYNANAESANKLERETIFITEHLADSFSKATSANDASSTYLNNNGVLRLNTETSFLQYNISGGRLNFLVNSQNYFLSSSDFNISRFYLQRILDQNNVTIGIRVTIDISFIKKPNITKTIETAYLIK